jgi:acyl carrier protein
MTRALSQAEVAARLLAFIRERFLAGDPQGELQRTTPLLEWGILNSLNTAILIGFIHAELGISVPADRVDASAFRSVESISSMLCEVAARPGALALPRLSGIMILHAPEADSCIASRGLAPRAGPRARSQY